MAKPRALRLLRERKLADLLPPPEPAAVFEASGVIVVKSDCFVVLDNTRRVARIDASLRLDSERNQWVGARRSGEGYEAVSYNPNLRRFFLMIEAEKHADGTYKAIVEEADSRWRLKGRTWVDFAFESRNTGFEGLAAVESAGRNYLLALCEGNGCRRSRKKPAHGKGRIHVLQRRQGAWHPVAIIKLPGHVDFQDYAGMALRGDRIAVVSQESSRLWIGRLNRREWRITGKGRIYDFPRTKKGKRLYHTVEGISWLTPTTLVAVSDLRKKRHPKRSARTDQSIHVFKVV